MNKPNTLDIAHLARTLEQSGTFNGSQLAPTLVQLGIAIGILRPVAGSAASYELNPDWFRNPLEASGDNLMANGAAIARLFATLLGEVSASALGLPAKDLGAMGTWNPIPYPGTEESTGFYLVSYPLDAAKPDADQVFGIGVLHEWDFAADGVVEGASRIAVRAWGLLPVLQIGGGGMEMVLGSRGYPLNMGVQVAGAGSGSIVSANGLQFNGVKFSAQLDLQASPAVDLSVVLLQLQLPTDTAPADRNLSEVAQITPQEWLSTVSTLFVSALQRVLGQDDRASNLLPVLGLSPIVPGSQTRLPLLRWNLMLEQARAGAPLTGPFVAWFNSLLADADAFPAWMGTIAALLGGDAQASGSGTAASPYVVPLLQDAKYGALALTMVTRVDADGTRYLLPGLNFRGAGHQLGNAPAQLQVQAQFDMAQFSLATSGQAGVSTGLLNLTMGFALASTEAGKPLFEGTVLGGHYRFGSLAGGVSILQSSSAPMKVVPAFQLVDVATPTGQFAAIDLTHPGDLVDQAIAELYTLVDAALQSMFGLAAGSSYGKQAAIMLGVMAPDAGAAWPAELAPPFSAARIGASFQDPVGALCNYYRDVLASTSPLGAQAPAYWLLSAAAALFARQGGQLPAPSGKGAPDDPWLFPLTGDALPASLLAWLDQPASGGARRLTLGLRLAPPVSVAGLDLDIGIDLHALGIALPAGAPAQACIFPGVAVRLALPGELKTPAVASAAVSVQGAAFAAGWSHYDSWRWNLVVGQPAIIVDGQRLPVGQDLVFSDSDSLDQLVTKQGKTFAPIVTALLGVAAYRTGNRPGLALDAVLGLLPNLGAFLPAGTDWPNGMPTWQPDGFTDPLGGIRQQLSALLKKPDTARAAMAVLGWATGSAVKLPGVAGDGSFASPYAVDASLPGGFDLAVWSAGPGATLGLGLQRSFGFSAAGIDTRTELLLRLAELELEPDGSAPHDPVPGLRLQTLVTPQAPLPLPTTDGASRSLVSMLLGLELALEQGSLVLQPQVLLTVGGAGGETVYDLAQLQSQTSEWQAAFDGLLNAGVAEFVTPLLANGAIANAYRVLELMNLTVPAEADAPAGVNAAGWRALLADPIGYVRGRGAALFTEADTRAHAVALLESITGIALPKVPLPMLQLLHTLQLVEAQESGFAPRLYDWVALAANPADELERRFGRLMGRPALVAWLSGELGLLREPVALGPVQLSVSEGALFQVSLLRDKLPHWGDLLQIGGGFSFDLRTSKLQGALELYCARLQLALRSQLAVDAGAVTSADLQVQLDWGNGAQPMPQALVLYPFDSGRFLQQAVALAPTFALSTFFSQVVDAHLLKQYPLARTALSALGLAFEDPDTGDWFTKSPLGLFGDPLGWLLGDAVLGADGKLNVAALARVFATIKEPIGGDGIKVVPIVDGLRIANLPYGQQIDLVADTVAQQFRIAPGLAAGSTLDLGHGVKLEEFAFALALGPNFQPGLAGSIALSGPASSSDTLLLKAGYDSEFRLSAGLAEGKGLFQVLPFPGWQTLVLEAGRQAAQVLLRELTGVLLDQLKAAGADKFVDSLRQAGQSLEVPQLVNGLIEVTGEGVDALADVALGWLCGRLSQANAPATVQAVASLLQPYAGGMTTAQGLLRFKPSDSIPVTLVSGVQTLGGALQLGLWVEMDIPAVSGIVLAIEPTGVGIPVNADGTLPASIVPQLHFQFALQALLEGDTGPKLAMRLDAANRALVVGVDPAGSAGADSAYYRELLPTFFGEQDSTKWAAAVLDWLEEILLNLVPRYLSVLVLNQKTVTQWLEAPLFPGKTGPSAAQVLTASRLLVQEGQPGLYMLNSLAALADLTLEQFLAGFLRALMAQQVQLLRIGEHGGIWIGPRAQGSDYLGVRVMVPDMALAALPNVTFQLGDTDTEWISNAGGDASLQGGIALYVPVSAEAPDFGKLQLQLVNIGLDLHGADGQDLVQMSRFSLGKIAPRGLITFDFADSKPVSGFGGGVMLGDIGVALAPNMATPGPKANPVAQNLLGSGNEALPQSANPATNPQFSVRTSYVKDLYVELFNSDGSKGTDVWFPVQRSFGPLHADQIGVGWDNADHLLKMLFDGNVSLAGLFIGLDRLSVGVPVLDPLDPSAYQLDLAGIDVRFNGGPVSIEGGFLKHDGPLRYDGIAMVKAAKFGLTALGSYAVVPIDPKKPDDTAASLFIFANLNMPLGPHPAFYINGLAAGFGYNRNLRIPEVGEIDKFPLVQGAVDSKVFGGKDAEPNSALEVLSQVVYPDIGQYWLAGGVQFTSFQLLNAFALLAVRFGREFAIDLIGIASASFPPGSPATKALAYVELGLLVSFRPSQGMVSARAQLTPNSFVLARDCRLTGGFAAVLWYEGDHAGDFVITLGGYNPAFSVPKHYPVVPALGFNWPMDIPVGSLNINGGTYFALTPSAVMAGGYLKALFETGPLRAWFAAGVDFLIQWEPFWFLLQADITVGAGFETEVAGVKLTLSAQLGASLVLAGPPVSGKVGVDWYVISFTIPFGDPNQGAAGSNPLDWDAFQQSFLPPLAIDPQGSTLRGAVPARLQRMQLAPPPPVAAQAYSVLKAQVEQGLIADYPGVGWVVQQPFQLSIGSVIPATTLQFAGTAGTPFSGPAIGIQPMAQPNVKTPLTVTLLGWNTAKAAWEPIDLDQRKIAIGRRLDGSPEALWSRQAFDPYGVPQAKTVPGTILGATLEAAQVQTYAPIGPMDLDTLGVVQLGPLQLPFAWTPSYPAQPVPSQLKRAQVIADTIMDPVKVVPLRNAILAALGRLGQPALRQADLSVLQHNVGNLFQSPPSLAPLGMDIAPAPQRATTQAQPVGVAKASAPTPTTGASEVLGSSRRYRAGQASQPVGKGETALPLTRLRSRAKWIAGSGLLASHSANGGLQLHMAPGATSIVRLGEQATRQVRVDGGLPLRLVSFDQHQEPLRLQVAAPAGAWIALPAATHEVVAMAAAGVGLVSGWYHDSEWTRLNHYYFHGDGCLVRPEAAPVVKNRERGQMAAAEVIAANRVRQAGGVLAPGWTETLFFDRPASVAVVCHGVEAPRVQLCWTADPASPPYQADSQDQPRRVVTFGALRIYLFDVPPRPDAQHQLALLAHGRHADGAPATVLGVLGLTAGHEAIVASLAGLMHCDAGAPGELPPPSSQLEFA